MMRTVPEDFQRKVDDWNAGHPGPAAIAIAYNPRDERWEVWAVPTEMSSFAGARNDVTARLVRPLPDDSSRQGIKLFKWAEYNEKGQEIGYLPLDNRVFDAIHYADSFRSKDHFKDTVSNPEVEKEVREKAHVRAIAAGAAQYWKSFDRPLVSMNPSIKSGGDWRWRTR